MSKLLRIALGIVATVAVGVGATVVGAHFAPIPHLTTQTVPVLAPLRVNGVATSTSGTGTLSPVVGETTVVTPGQKGASPIGAQVQSQISALDAADGADPAGAHRIVTGGGPDPTVSADDPCSPASGSPATDCPDGVHGAVYADMHYGALSMHLKAKPPYAQHDSVFDCPQPTLASGELLFDVVTNIPADITLTYWPLDGSATARSIVLHGASADLSTWNSYYSTHGNAYNYTNFVFQHCGTLTGIRANTAYVGSAVALDSFGRTSDPVLANFTNSPDPTYPTMSAIPLTNSILYTSVPFAQGGQQPVVKAWVVPSGAPADCTSYDQRQQELQTAQAEGVFQVSADYLRANNYVANFNQRVVDIFEVPEGSTIVVCARTFAASAPSWDRTRPTAQQFIRLQSPDAAIPVVTVKRLHLQRDLASDAVTITGTTQFGVPCGVHSFMSVPDSTATSGSTVTVDRVLCDARSAGTSDIAAAGSTSNIVVSTAAHIGGTNYVNRATLPLSRYACVGACPTLPATLDYTIPLASQTAYRPMTSCTDPSGCSYPATDNSTGSADLEVTWVRGSSNGLAHWAVGNPDATLTPVPTPDTPQLDQNTAPTVGLSTDGLSGLATFPIRVDRHVTYRLSLSGSCFAAGAPREYSGQTSNVFGASVQSSTQAVIGLCPDTTYNATIGLTDDAGHFASYTASTPVDAAHAWTVGTIHTPFDSIRIDATFSLTSPANYYHAWGSTGVDLSVNAIPSEYVTPFRFGCFQATTAEAGFTAVQRTATIPLTATIHINALTAAIQENLNHGRDLDADCGWTDQRWFEPTIVADVSYADLSRGVTLSTTRTPDEPFLFSIHLVATNLGETHS